MPQLLPDLWRRSVEKIAANPVTSGKSKKVPWPIVWFPLPPGPHLGVNGKQCTELRCREGINIFGCVFGRRAVRTYNPEAPVLAFALFTGHMVRRSPWQTPNDPVPWAPKASCFGSSLRVGYEYRPRSPQELFHCQLAPTLVSLVDISHFAMAFKESLAASAVRRFISE